MTNKQLIVDGDTVTINHNNGGFSTEIKTSLSEFRTKLHEFDPSGAISSNFDTGFMPGNDAIVRIVYRQDGGATVVYRSTSKFVNFKYDGRDATDDYSFWTPPMLWFISFRRQGEEFYIEHEYRATNAAMVFDEVIKGDTPIYFAPFHNLFNDGKVCWGNHYLPYTHPNEPASIDKYFFSLPANEDLAPEINANADRSADLSNPIFKDLPSEMVDTKLGLRELFNDRSLNNTLLQKAVIEHNGEDLEPPRTIEEALERDPEGIQRRRDSMFGLLINDGLSGTTNSHYYDWDYLEEYYSSYYEDGDPDVPYNELDDDDAIEVDAQIVDELNGNSQSNSALKIYALLEYMSNHWQQGQVMTFYHNYSKTLQYHRTVDQLMATAIESAR